MLDQKEVELPLLVLDLVLDHLPLDIYFHRHRHRCRCQIQPLQMSYSALGQMVAVIVVRYYTDCKCNIKLMNPCDLCFFIHSPEQRRFS